MENQPLRISTSWHKFLDGSSNLNNALDTFNATPEQHVGWKYSKDDLRANLEACHDDDDLKLLTKYKEPFKKEAIELIQTKYAPKGMSVFKFYKKIVDKFVEHLPDLKDEIEECMYGRLISLASPILFNILGKKPALASCYVLDMDDSIESIFDKIKDCAIISKNGGGIGLNITKIRANGSLISTGFQATGIVGLLKVLNAMSTWINQGGRRPGSIAVYMEPWHADIMDFLEARSQFTPDEKAARDLFYGLWMPELFYIRVEQDGDWHLFSPSDAPLLAETYGETFYSHYCQYVKEGKFMKVMKARTLMDAIIKSLIENGMPYVMNKDVINTHYNPTKELVRSGNLCAEIAQPSNPYSYPVCILGAVNLDMAMTSHQQKLAANVIAQMLNVVLDISYYPCDEAESSVHELRAIGIGIVGLADYFQNNNTAYGDSIALNNILNVLNKSSKQGSESYHNKYRKNEENKYIMAFMPTASTSIIMGANESFEPYISNIFIKQIGGKDIKIFSPVLAKILFRNKENAKEIINKVIMNNGKLTQDEYVTAEEVEIGRTAWEIPLATQMKVIEMLSSYTDQSVSANVFVENPTHKSTLTWLMSAYKRELPTSVYYFRTRAASDSEKITICNRFNKECTSCSA